MSSQRLLERLVLLLAQMAELGAHDLHPVRLGLFLALRDEGAFCFLGFELLALLAGAFGVLVTFTFTFTLSIAAVSRVLLASGALVVGLHLAVFALPRCLADAVALLLPIASAVGFLPLSADGRRLWAATLREPRVVGPPVVRDHAAWFVTREGTIEALGLADGAVVRHDPLGVAPSGGLLVVDDDLVIPTGTSTWQVFIPINPPAFPSPGGPNP